MPEKEFEKERIRNFFDGEMSEGDSSYIENIINDGGHDRELKRLMNEQFSSLSVDDDETENERLEKILHSINYKILSERSGKEGSLKYRLLNMVAKVAAVLLLPLLVYSGWSIYHEYHTEKEIWVEIDAPSWTRAQFMLPDGSKGWLNSNSSVKYRGDFLKNRQIQLTGEAFFDVARDPSHPFIVNTADIQLEVLGTKFNVASYNDEKNIEVVLEEGSLKFVNLKMNKFQIMKPNDLIVYDKEQSTIVSDVIQPMKYLSWTQGNLVFRNDPIDVVARRISRWYNADVVLRNDIDSNLRLRATFVDESLEEVMKLLKLSLPITYSIENASAQTDTTFTRKKVIISSGNKKRNKIKPMK